MGTVLMVCVIVVHLGIIALFYYLFNVTKPH